MNAIQNPVAQAATPAHRANLLPGVLWFILADIMVFFMIFADFMMQRAGQLDVFEQSAATLDVQLGVLNTLILITSGLFVVFAVNAAKAGDRGATRRWLLVSFVVGAGFAVTKWYEWSGKLDQGITMYTNDYYMFYYTLTGAHFLHFIGGMVALAILWFLVGRQQINARLLNTIEAGALYWHMVDLLWIFLFPMLYLLGAR
ncbi:cytochrome c oxidase subunit 3 [Pseudomonas sp. GD03721]|uniref:cytochrome c oxidase subunit 3 n=1 Tax=Pseudomonas TaxID=286 RepID=UPI00093C92C3|nr:MULTISPECIES: cytochrome c oxidase subunit 3 [Pseudomonas]MDH0639353.1 cytochrome c oxidase subunit 3 [Pseudomonas sp. GD03860]MDH1440464.1 cytochrome c oxidase subunit 3 [Pseudomonas sp. GD03722]WGG03448.1 cytochrome c oxidase subunit 3 [Pseudomonas sp. GD03721]WGG07616.1 cytochrome c oxidase subunit 3 [Pseudomonas sp. GD03919]